ncbi:TUG-UBL1 domain-containing protein [Aphelenchoides fujianensis]|nr:TUG-UBL1 domain-containing protein [Aphelenchoides fujianensis]
MSALTVLCPNARRCKVETKPGKLLREVLEEACLRQGFEIDRFGLQFQRKFVDLGLPVRLSGLPNNATLELIEREPPAGDARAEIALQGDFPRLVLAFPIVRTLHEVLAEFSAQLQLDLLREDGERVPAVSYMNQMCKSHVLLERTTLKAIGIEGGRALLRYSLLPITADERAEIQRKVEAEERRKAELQRLFEQSRAENDERARLDAQYTKEVEEREKRRLLDEEKKRAEAAAASSAAPQSTAPMETEAPAAPPDRLSRLQGLLDTVSSSLESGLPDALVDRLIDDQGRLRLDGGANGAVAAPNEQANEFADFKFPAVPVATVGQLLDADRNAAAARAAPSDRRLVLFERTPEAVAEEALEEDFFEVTINDAKRHQQELAEKSRELSQQALLPRAFVEARNKERKLECYRNAVVRFRFSDRLFVQALFYSAEPVDRLFDLVASLLKAPAPPFELNVLLNEKLKRDASRDFVDAGLAPTATINVQLKGAQATKAMLNAERVHACSPDEADSISAEWLSANTPFKRETFTVAPEAETQLKKRNRHEDYPSSSSSAQPMHHSPSAGPLPKWFKKN